MREKIVNYVLVCDDITGDAAEKPAWLNAWIRQEKIRRITTSGLETAWELNLLAESAEQAAEEMARFAEVIFRIKRRTRCYTCNRIVTIPRRGLQIPGFKEKTKTVNCFDCALASGMYRAEEEEEYWRKEAEQKGERNASNGH